MPIDAFFGDPMLWPIRVFRYLCNLNLRGNKIADDPACRVQAQEWVPKLRIFDGQSTDANTAKVASKREAEAYDAARKAKKKKYLTKDESKQIKAHVGTVSFDDADGPAVVQMGMAPGVGPDKQKRPRAADAFEKKGKESKEGKEARAPRPSGGRAGSDEAAAAASKTTIKVKSKKNKGKAAAPRPEPEPAPTAADEPAAAVATTKKGKGKKLKLNKAGAAALAEDSGAATNKKSMKKKKREKSSTGAAPTPASEEAEPAPAPKLAKPNPAKTASDVVSDAGQPAPHVKVASAPTPAPAKQAKRTADAIEARSQTAGASGMLSVQNAKRKRSEGKQAFTPDTLGAGLPDALFGAAAIGGW